MRYIWTQFLFPQVGEEWRTHGVQDTDTVIHGERVSSLTDITIGGKGPTYTILKTGSMYCISRTMSSSLPSALSPPRPAFELQLIQNVSSQGMVVLTVYNPEQGSQKGYVVSQDRCLRESPNPNSAHLPPFRHTPAHHNFSGMVLRRTTDLLWLSSSQAKEMHKKGRSIHLAQMQARRKK